MKVARPRLCEIIGGILLLITYNTVVGQLIVDHNDESFDLNSFAANNNQRNLSLDPPDWIDGCKGSTLGVQTRRRLYQNEYICLFDDIVGATYGFGLDENGVLGERRRYDNYQGGVWSSGFSGDFVAMQSDGNLVLYKDGTIIWASGCRANNARLIVSDDNGDFEPGYVAVESMDEADDENAIVWRIYPGGVESGCFPTAAPPVICKGTTLPPGEMLHRNEYVCSPNGRSRLGLNDRGQLILNTRVQRMAIVWSPGASITADRLLQQRDGNLVLYEKNGSSVWASSCRRPGASVYMSNYYLYSMLGGGLGDIIWYMDYKDPVLQCQENLYEPCTKAAVVGSTCRMHMVDHDCRDYVSAQVLELGDNKFSFTTAVAVPFCVKDYEGGDSYVIEATSSGEVGIWTCGDIMSESQDDIWLLQEKSDHLEFYYDPEYPCTRFGKNLIYHAIVEYWYD